MRMKDSRRVVLSGARREASSACRAVSNARRAVSSSRLLVLLLALVLPALLPPSQGSAQSGVLIPSSIKDQPDDSILSLALMNVDVLVDNQHARVRVLQIFDSHSPQVLERKYLFDLSPRA